MTTLADRLKLMRKSIGLEQKEVASILNISFRSWQDYEAGKSIPGGKVFETLVKLGFNANWLLAAEGPMELGKGAAEVRELAAKYCTGNNVEVNVFALAGAGNPNELLDMEPVAVIVIPLDFYKPSIVPVLIRGRSMEETILDGAIVGVDREDKWIISGEIYAIWIPHEGAVVKRLYLDTEKIICKSDNPKFGDIIVPLGRIDEHFIQGRVKWVIQKY